MEELSGLASGKHVATNQVLYNPERRGIEHDLVPWCSGRGVPIMAYSPVGQGRLLRNAGVVELAKKHDASPAQIVLAWVMRLDGMIAIPKATRTEHVRDNAGALEVRLSVEDLAALDRLFAPPRRKQPLEMI
jgi:diketogulonate reductase-like aldo/keto reductase